MSFVDGFLNLFKVQDDENLTHGISVYDRIILDALKYQPNEMIY